MPRVIPLEAIDPDASFHRWSREFEHHLDLVPPIMDEMVGLTLPHIRADQLKPKITGGGYVDNVSIDHLRVTADGLIVDVGAGRDATHLWATFVEYVRAVTAWLNAGIPVPLAPLLPPLASDAQQWVAPRPDADPLTARSVALVTVGWLIELGPRIEPIHELDDYRESMFRLIRRLRGRYSVVSSTPPPRRRCAICGRLAVVVAWVDGPKGSPKPIQVARCQACHQIYAEGQAA